MAVKIKSEFGCYMVRSRVVNQTNYKHLDTELDYLALGPNYIPSVEIRPNLTRKKST